MQEEFFASQGGYFDQTGLFQPEDFLKDGLEQRYLDLQLHLSLH